MLPVLLTLMLAVTVHGGLNVTQVADVMAPWENPMQYIAQAADGHGAFIVDTGKFVYQAQHLLATWESLMGEEEPLFVFITHGHPDHTGGLAYLNAKWPTLKIYCIDHGVQLEAQDWRDLVCTQFKGTWTPEQCGFSYNTSITLIPKLDPMEPVDQGFTAVSGLHAAETQYAGMLVYKDATTTHVFSGDILSMRSHLYMSDFFFGGNKYPVTDQLACGWAGDVLNMACSLPDNAVVYPGHGPTSAAYQAENGVTLSQAMEEILDWLRIFRQQSFNSCNASYVWDHMIQAFPAFGMTSYLSIGGLSAHVPADAMALGCRCSDGAPNTCGGQSPPECRFLDGTATVPACL